MKAVVFHEPGQLHLDDLPLPSFNPLVPAVNLNSTGSTPAEPAPRASGTRKRRKARAPK